MPLLLSHPALILSSLALMAFLSACASTKEQGPSSDHADSNIPQPGAFSRPEPGQGITELDTNGDLRTDMVKIWSQPPSEAPENEDGTSSALLLRKEVDLNFDGKVDLWSFYNAAGEVIRQAYDLDFDGKVDVIAHYEKGVVVRKEVFHTFGDEPDTFKYYEKGKLQRVERDSNRDGRIDTWEYWDGDEIDRVGQDLTGNGNVDRWTKQKPKK